MDASAPNRAKTTQRTTLHHRSLSPAGRFCSSATARRASPTRVSISRNVTTRAKKMTCACSPTTHPGSFRCSLHKSSGQSTRKNGVGTTSYQLNITRRSAMRNSLVRIGTLEGELVKRALAALIRPSSHSQRRREDFRPRPSRLSVMTRAED